ncbi:MAG TPA: hypothetical protein VGK48_15900 [Terriglobia bacterium]|jgi:hypothetical protein
MTLRRTTQFALAALLAITLTGLTAHAQQFHSTSATSVQDLNLSDAQVFKIQALLMSQTAKVRTLAQNVQAAQDTLSAAIAKGDPTLTATAVLSLDAAEKALKNTELANQRNLMALLNDSQKQVVKDYSIKSIPVSD